MEQKLGRLLEPGEHVHHKNGDKLDNSLDNLELVTNIEHARKHVSQTVGKYKRSKPCVMLTCSWCGCSFLRVQYRVNARLKRGQTNFFCNKSHQVKFQHKYQT